MDYEDINYNQIIISGHINNITDTNNQYIKFSMVSKKYTTSENKNVYVSLNISRELYNIYLDYFYKGNKVFVKGYLNSYIDKNKNIKLFISVTDISDNPNGVRVWNGKREEVTPMAVEEQQELEELLKEFK